MNQPTPTKTKPTTPNNELTKMSTKTKTSEAPTSSKAPNEPPAKPDTKRKAKSYSHLDDVSFFSEDEDSFEWWLYHGPIPYERGDAQETRFWKSKGKDPYERDDAEKRYWETTGRW
jgi:hypothetical protein